MARANLDLFDDADDPPDAKPPRRSKASAPSATCAEPDCGKPLMFRCHHCERPLCIQHLSPRFMVAHCTACANTHHGRGAVLAQTEMKT